MENIGTFFTHDDWEYFKYNAIGTFLVHEFVWFVFNLPFMLMSIYPIAFFQQYTIRQKVNYDKAAMLKCLKKVLLNQASVMVPFLAIFQMIMYKVTPFKMSIDFNNIPNWRVIAWEVFLSVLIEDMVFYFAHRLLHTSYFYKRIHKIHHEWKAPFSWASEYAHPLELLLGNIAPTALGPFLLRSHIIVLWIWLTIRIAITTDVHSGYKFPWNPERFLGFIYAGATHHDLHHKIFIGNYSSVFTYLDYLFGTVVHEKTV